MTGESLEKLRAIYAEMTEAASQSDAVKYSRLSQIFDDTVLDVADVVRLRLVIDFLGKQTIRYRYFGFKLRGRLAELLKAHGQILDAFSKRDCETAGQIVYKVIERAGESILSQAFGTSPESVESAPMTTVVGAERHREA